MTRKDYVAIAAVIRKNIDEWGNREAVAGCLTVAEDIADVMAQDNPRFDRERFLKACGVQS